MSDFDPWKEGSRTRLSEDFVSGMKHFNNDDWEAALDCFRAADKAADIDDVYHARYTSFHGLVRVIMGDEQGVKLCRQAAVGEQTDADIYCNLARAEDRLGYREGAVMALRRGLKIDAGHPGLKRLRDRIGLRDSRGILPGLPRHHFLNHLFGRLLRRRRRSRAF